MRMLTDKGADGRVKGIFLHVVSSSSNPPIPNDAFINGKVRCWKRC